jgi:starch phosphorylase
MNIPPECPTVRVEDDRTGLSIETLRRAMADHLFYLQGRWPEIATRNDFYMALAYTVRDRMLQRWLNTKRTLPPARCAGGVLPLGRIPPGSPPGQ